MALSGWSTAASSNATVGSIDWAEGMAPAQVNNSARQMMADVADWYRNGTEWIARADTATYVSSTSLKFTGVDRTSIYSVGRRIKVVAATPGTIYGLITASAYSTDTTLTITWDSGSLSNEAITSISPGIIKNATTGQSLDAGNIKRIREFGMPAGAMVAFGSTTAPSGWLLCYGQTISRTTYADLFTAIGTTYGSTDSATFKVPDRRGRVSRCLNNLGGSSAATFTGATTLGGTGGSKTTTATGTVSVTVADHILSITEIPAHTHSLDFYSNQPSSGSHIAASSNTLDTTGATGSAGGGGAHGHTGSSGTFTGDAVNSFSPYIADAWIIKT